MSRRISAGSGKHFDLWTLGSKRFGRVAAHLSVANDDAPASNPLSTMPSGTPRSFSLKSRSVTVLSCRALIGMPPKSVIDGISRITFASFSAASSVMSLFLTLRTDRVVARERKERGCWHKAGDQRGKFQVIPAGIQRFQWEG
eukprot:5619836-Prymnesium_polylepis.1